LLDVEQNVRTGRTTQERDMREFIKRLVIEEEGMEMVEWALVAAVFALAGIAAWGTLASTLSTALNTIGTRVSTAVADGVANS
jgi:Flp pilus assembly pilin Flp